MAKKLKTKKTLGLIALLIFVAMGIFSLSLSDKYTVPILMYHSITVSEKLMNNVVSPKSFEYQMGFLKRHHYHVIGLDELVEATETHKSLPHNTAVITFDDGYIDNYTNAFPILKKYNFPATIFVITEAVDENGYLTWKQIREMEKFKIKFESHTCNHVYLPGTSLKIQQHEIEQSKKTLEEKLGHPIHFLAYPSGGFTDKIVEILKSAGYKAACTTNRGYNRFNQDLYELRRIRFNDDDNIFDIPLWAKLSGYYNLFRTLKKPF